MIPNLVLLPDVVSALVAVFSGFWPLTSGCVYRLVIPLAFMWRELDRILRWYQVKIQSE